MHTCWSGGARARPRDENFLREGGSALGRPSSVCNARRRAARRAEGALLAQKCIFCSNVLFWSKRLGNGTKVTAGVILRHRAPIGRRGAPKTIAFSLDYLRFAGRGASGDTACPKNQFSSKMSRRSSNVHISSKKWNLDQKASPGTPRPRCLLKPMEFNRFWMRLREKCAKR